MQGSLRRPLGSVCSSLAGQTGASGVSILSSTCAAQVVLQALPSATTAVGTQVRHLTNAIAAAQAAGTQQAQEAGADATSMPNWGWWTAAAGIAGFAAATLGSDVLGQKGSKLSCQSNGVAAPMGSDANTQQVSAEAIQQLEAWLKSRGADLGKTRVQPSRVRASGPSVCIIYERVSWIRPPSI